MALHRFGRSIAAYALPLLSFAGALPSFAQAAVLSFRNDTSAPVVVQVRSLVNNIPRPGRAQVVMPGKSYAELAVPGNKQIIIADARQPTRILFNDTIPVEVKDQYFAIQADAPAAPANKQGSARQVLGPVKLVPIEAPAKSKSGTGTPAPRRSQGRQSQSQ
jgi:hypothetical protein